MRTAVRYPLRSPITSWRTARFPPRWRAGASCRCWWATRSCSPCPRRCNPMTGVSRSAIAAAVAAIAASLPVLAEDARGLLERMEHVLSTRNYQGTFVHEHDGQTETMRIVHRAENGDFAERVVSLDGSGREVVQREGELRAYFPDQRVV